VASCTKVHRSPKTNHTVVTSHTTAKADSLNFQRYYIAEVQNHATHVSYRIVTENPHSTTENCL